MLFNPFHFLVVTYIGLIPLIPSLKIRPHSSLDNYSPIWVHWDSHTSSHIARLVIRSHISHQKQAYIEASSKTKVTRLQVGDLVLLKNKRKPFQKLSSVFYPRYASKVHRIRKIDKRYLPWCYILSELPDSRKFYSFELQKLDKSFGTSRPTVQQVSQIRIKDVILQDASKLRSGRVVKGKGTLMYIIERNGSEDIVPEATLKILKHSLGSSALKYDPSFNSEEKNKFVV